MKIFFIGAIRGGRELQPKYLEIVDLLKKYGDIEPARAADETISKYGETELTQQEIHDRELSRISNCDILIAEVTTPSLGVGYEIAKALEMNKRVLCLSHGENTYKLSAMIKGNPKIEVCKYQSLSDLKKLLEKNLNN